MSKVVRIAEENNVFRRVTDERNKRIVDKLKQGLTVTEVAKSENIDNTTVIRSARKSNFQIKFNKNEVRNEEIKKDLLAGIKDSIFAAKYKLSEGSIKRLKRGFGLTKEYHFLPVTNGFRFDEIKEQSQNITKLRETYRRFKLGERTPEILEEMEKTLDILKAKIQEFKSRFE